MTSDAPFGPNPAVSIRFVLVRPSVPGNIGATARAMKTMGLNQLWVVQPDTPLPHKDATRRAVDAVDVLDQAQVVDTLSEALADCQLTVAISARKRTADWPVLSPQELSQRVAESQGSIALVFGPERAGLSNAELYQCRLQSAIASNPEFPSLNLSHAAQIYAWQLAQHVVNPGVDRSERPSQQQMDHLNNQVSALLDCLNFAPPNPDDPRLTAALNRADLKLADWSLLEGVVQRTLTRLRNQ